MALVYLMVMEILKCDMGGTTDSKHTRIIFLDIVCAIIFDTTVQKQKN
jgi:hypothetical protein